MDYSDKIARYQEIERRGLLNQLPIEKQEAWAEYKRRQTPELTLTDEQKAKIQATKDEYARRQAERDSDQWFVSLVENKQDDPLKNFARSTARLGLSGMQGVANAGFNPFSDTAKAMGADLKPIKPENYAERMAELGGEAGYDAAALYTVGKLAGEAGLLGQGISNTSKIARAGLIPTVPLAEFLAPVVAGAYAEGYFDPRNPFERTLANVGGAMTYGGIESALKKEVKNVAGGLKNILKDNKANAVLSKGIKSDENIAQQISNEAPAVYNQLNDEVTTFLEKLTGRKLDINKALDTQQQRYKDFVSKNADVELYSPKSAQEQSAENFKRWFDGSKVVDENGQPRRYYHGSLRKFDKFKQANNDYNFAPDEKFAYNYAESKGFEQGIDAEPQLYEVFLNSKKPFDFENPEDIKNLSSYIKGKKIRVFGNPKKEEEFLRNLKGEYYDTKLDEGEFEKLLSDKYNKWYSPDNRDVNYEQSSVNTDKIFSVNPGEEYFITGSAPWGYNIDDVKPSQIEDAIKNLDFGKNKRHQIPVDIETPYGNRVIDIDLKRIDKPSAKNLKRGADNWINIESADFDGEDLIDALKKMGYDGYYKQENGTKNLSVFSPDQIKSVNNSGAWSSSPSLSDAGWTPKNGLEQYTQGLDEFQVESLKKAINQGAKMSTNAKGSLGATHRAQEVLNDMIDASYDTSIIGKKRPTTETRELMKVKERLNEILEPSGIKPFDEGIAKSKNLQTNFEKGYNFKPSEIKFENLGLETLRDKRAFLQGRIQKITDNVLSDGGTSISKAIQKDENTLRKLMPEKKFNQLMNKAGEIETQFKRLKSLEGQANRELVKDAERGSSINRENWESKGALLGRISDVLGGAIARKGRANLAKKYLDPETTQIIRMGGLRGFGKGAGSAATRQTIFDLLNRGE